MKKSVLLLAGIIAAAGLTSCNSSLDVKANTDCSATVNFNMDLGDKLFTTIENMTAGIAQLNSGAGVNQEIVLFSEKDVSDALKDSDLENLQVAVPSKKEIKIRGKLKKSTAVTKNVNFGNFVTCEKNSLTVVMSPENIQIFKDNLPEDTKSYIDLLMAPVFSDEEMSNEDYLDVVSLVYGDELTDVMKKAKVSVNLCCPEGKNIISAKADGVEQKKSAVKASFAIPLVSLLTLTNQLTYSINW